MLASASAVPLVTNAVSIEKSFYFHEDIINPVFDHKTSSMLASASAVPLLTNAVSIEESFHFHGYIINPVFYHNV